MKKRVLFLLDNQGNRSEAMVYCIFMDSAGQFKAMDWSGQDSCIRTLHVLELLYS